MDVVTPTRNRCVIEIFVGVFVLSLCPFDISVGVEAFVIGLSQISFFLLLLILLRFVLFQYGKSHIAKFRNITEQDSL